MPDRPLSGASALVTGADAGNGAAAARRLARDGAAVALVGHRRELLEQVAADIIDRGGHAVAMPADITEPDPAYQAVQDTLDRFGRLDILVNSTGLTVLNSALHATLEEWDRLISVNIRALLHVTHAAVPFLIDAATTSPRKVADLVNVGLTAGRVVRPDRSVYNLTGFGLYGFTESLRQELEPEDVRVGMVEPGTTDGSGLPPSESQTQQADCVAEAIGYMVTRGPSAAINKMIISFRSIRTR